MEERSVEREVRWESWGWWATGIEEEECRHLGREGIGVREIPWRVPGQPSSAVLKGDQVPGSAGSCRGKYWDSWDPVCSWKEWGHSRVMFLDQQYPCRKSLRESTMERWEWGEARYLWGGLGSRTEGKGRSRREGSGREASTGTVFAALVEKPYRPTFSLH